MFVASPNLIAQVTKISGFVKDSLTGESLPFANVYLKATSIGATTDFNGAFSINSKSKSDSLVVSCVGYQTVTIKIQLNKYQELNIMLLSSNTQLEEVVIVPTENPAHRIIRNAMKNKEVNSHTNINTYQCETYNKIQFDANNITDRLAKNRLMKPFEFVFEHVDTSTVSGKSYLPIFIYESISDNYFRNKPSDRKEIIKASQTSGFKNASVSFFMNSLTDLVDVYQDYIMLFEKNFISPISDNALFTYRYYLIDSASRDGHWCYHIMFKPKRKQELTFTGELWIADTSFAIQELKMSMANDANLNFVNAFEVHQSFKLIDGKYWFLTFDNVIVDFSLIENSKKATGFYGHKTTSYRDIIFDKPLDDSYFKSPNDIVFEKDALDKSEDYWKEHRHEELSKEEETIFKVVDTLIHLPAFKTYREIISTIMYGYYSFKKWDFGPYYQSFSFNEIEGYRIRLGGQTGYDWNNKLRFSGYTAYGTSDFRFKYGLSGLYLFEQNPRKALQLSYKYDVEQLGQSINAFNQDNIVASLIRRRPFTKLTMVEEFKGVYDYEYFNGLSNRLTFRRRTAYPLQGTSFEILPGTSATLYKGNIITSELNYNVRFAYKEKFFVDKFSRTSLGTTFPVINLWYSYGIPKLWNSEYEFHKLSFSINDWFNIKGLGWSRYIITGGKTWGTLPYPLLEIHGGNETYTFDELAFNRMNYYEFISDQYLSVYYTHHFDGFFLNHIPLMRKLKWREVVYARGLVGSLSTDNQKYSTFLPFSGALGKPYLEAGVAVENIFKIVRIDAVWRLTHLENQDIIPFGFMATLYLAF